MVEAGQGVRLLLRASWQPGPREERPALLIVHGLGGSDASSYVVSTGRLAYARGWHVVRMNMRGSGDGEALCPLLYNAGLDTDLLAATSVVCQLVPRVAVVGFSLGGNLTLLMLGRRRELLPAGARGPPRPSRRPSTSRPAPTRSRPAATGSTSTTSCGCWARPTGAGTRRAPTCSPRAASSGCARVREFDDRITAPFGGYESAAQYYERSSAGPWLAAIDRPALLLAAQDDPMIPTASVTRWPLLADGDARDHDRPAATSASWRARRRPGWFWAPERALDFLAGAAAG